MKTGLKLRERIIQKAKEKRYKEYYESKRAFDLALQGGTNLEKINNSKIIFDEIHKEDLEYLKMQERIRKETEPKEPEPYREIDILSFYKLFKKAYFKVEGVSFDAKKNNGETGNLAFTIFYHLFRKHNFHSSPLLTKKEDFKPSLSKGNIIVGSYGIGKSSIFKAIHYLKMNASKIKVLDVDGKERPLAMYTPLFSFKYVDSRQVVRDYSKLDKNEDKALFVDKFKHGELVIDELIKEDEANNYGKRELFKEILEIRYKHKKRTSIIMNYKPEEVLSLDNTIQEIGERYGSDIYSRLFKMCNVIELKGKDLRE